MVIINVEGGLANQLYRYACGYNLAKRYQKELVIVALDCHYYANPYLLDELNIPLHRKLIISSNAASVLNEIMRVCAIQKLLLVNEDNYESVNQKTFEKYDAIYVDAPFQRKKYYIDVIDDLRLFFCMKEQKAELAYFRKIIKDAVSVGVHIRRGDFVYHAISGNNFEYFENTDFYKAAIAYCEEHLNTPIFYIISDDIEYAKQLLGTKSNIKYIHIIGGADADLEEFFCLSMCNYRILTQGSSYGRMAAIINGKGFSVYPGNKENTEDFIYLDEEQISRYKRVFNEKENEIENRKNTDIIYKDINKLKAGDLLKLLPFYYDNGNINQTENHRMYLIKAVCQYKCCDFIGAEMTFIRAWQFWYDNKIFHYYYFLTLIALKKYNEAVLEAVKLYYLHYDMEVIKKYFPEDMLERLENLMKVPMTHFVIAPKECYKNATTNRLRNLGVLLKRMGHEVTYIFREAQANDGGTIGVHNYILQNKYTYTDFRNYNYRSRMYDLERIVQQQDLGTFLCDMAEDRNLWIISRNVDFFTIEYLPDNIKTIFWDFSNVNDIEHSMAYPKSILQKMYDHAQFVISEKKGGEPQNRFFGEGRTSCVRSVDEKNSLSEYYAYEDEMYAIIYLLNEIVKENI